MKLAVKDLTCSRDVLGNKQKWLLDALLKLIEESKEGEVITDLAISTLKIGAPYLLPEPEKRVELLLALLPKSSEDLLKATKGEVLLIFFFNG